MNRATQNDKILYPIIESSGHISWLIRLRDVIFTILMWCMYFYFMRNFFFFMADFFSWFFHGFDDASRYESFKIVGTLVGYLKIIVFMGWIFIMWAVYNKLRFGNKKRRMPSLPLEAPQIAQDYNVKLDDLSVWQDARTMIMHHESDGHLSRVEVLN